MNGNVVCNDEVQVAMEAWNKKLKEAKYIAKFHGDELLADQHRVLTGPIPDLRAVFTFKNAKQIWIVAWKMLKGQGLDPKNGAQLVGSLPNDSAARSRLIEKGVTEKYDKMLHPPLTYLGDAFQYRQADGKFNSVLHPHLGQAGAPYAKTVPSKTHPLGALPDPSDLFDRLMARQIDKNGVGRPTKSGLSSMLIYHATIIIHDIFRTNEGDKNISDSSSYLDLSPLYGYTEKMQRKIRDNRYKLGFLKPDTFAEDRLLRQPPGVCIMLVMYNRYHNYAATQLRRINENGRFSMPTKYQTEPKLLAIAENCIDVTIKDDNSGAYSSAVEDFRAAWDTYCAQGQAPSKEYKTAEATFQSFVDGLILDSGRGEDAEKFAKAYDAAWTKLDDDLFNTARLITCGIYIQISIHDYLRALMGFHKFNTNFTLDPRIAMTEHKNVSRGLGNQVTVEFNLLYRFHCAISRADEEYTEDFMREKGVPAFMEKHKCTREEALAGLSKWDPKNMSLKQYIDFIKADPASVTTKMSDSERSRTKKAPAEAEGTKTKAEDVEEKEPWEKEFGLEDHPQRSPYFKRNPITHLFNDEDLVKSLVKSMDDPISNFGPRNVPKVLKNVEIMGILQARKWEIGTLNDFRDFFGMRRHKTFEDITKNVDVQNALRDLYDHPDKVELYPGVFCESDEDMGLDPGPSDVDSALWAAIFSDAITLVRSDRFYTVDWNTNSLTSWGMKEVSPDNDVLKSSVFHRLVQRSFPEWFPYDSVRFFHPFYTAQKNAEFAQQQGYSSDFKIRQLKPEKVGDPGFDIDGSQPEKPLKPLYLYKHADIKTLLAQDRNTISNPVCLDQASLPPKVAEVLALSYTLKAAKVDLSDRTQQTIDYFTSLMREIIQREIITMVDGDKPIYQIDVTRDLAIPVITRYISEFLGFSDRVRTEEHGDGFSENQIYQHITNCHVFLSYNADETKMLKRRKAFKTSMEFLYKLAESGTIKRANRWTLTRGIRGAGRFFLNLLRGRPKSANYMETLGVSVAESILVDEKDTGRAAAILLLIALDSAFNSVLAFTSVLEHLFENLYQGAYTKDGKSKLGKIQRLAFSDTKADDKRIKSHVMKYQRLAVNLPLVRKAVANKTIKDEKTGVSFKIVKGQTIICDVHRAMQDVTIKDDDKGKDKKKDKDNDDYLSYGSSLSESFVDFSPKETAVLCLTSMIKVMAQMKNLRRGHDTQGQVKKVQIDQTSEGWANFMAPMRVNRIAYEVAQAKHGNNIPEYARNVYDARVLKPSTDIYMTPEWDEMVPFPTTWKIRFDGYGPSTYGADAKADPINGWGLPWLRKVPLPDHFPPFYQPQGASHYGGSFADTVCVCSVKGIECKCAGTAGKGGKEEQPLVPKKGMMPADWAEPKMGGCGAMGTVK